MRIPYEWLLPMLFLAGCAQPAEEPPNSAAKSKRPPHTERPDQSGKPYDFSQELSSDEAKALIPAAASMSLSEFDQLLKHTPVRVRDIKNQSLTALLLAIDPAYAQDQNPQIRGEFHYLTPDNEPRIRELFGAVMGKQGSRIVSLIQPEYITKCTCITRGDAANGSVSYRAGDVYAGSADFIARRGAEGWQIVEFRLSEYGLVTKRQPDGHWRLASEETLLGVSSP